LTKIHEKSSLQTSQRGLKADADSDNSAKMIKSSAFTAYDFVKI